MKKKMKRITALLLAVLVLLGSVLAASASEGTDGEMPPDTLMVSVSGEGTVEIKGAEQTGDGTYAAAAGTWITAEAAPKEGWEVSAVNLNGTAFQEGFAMPEGNSILNVTFVESRQEEPEKQDVPEPAEGEKEEAEDTVVNSRGIEVKRSLLCDDPDCLEEHVGKTLRPEELPEGQAAAASAGRNKISLMAVEDPYVDMVVEGNDASVLFIGEPGTPGDFSVEIKDGDLQGAWGTGWCLNHGAANPGEDGWVTCTWEAICTAVSEEERLATWSFEMEPPGACDPGSVLGYQRVGMVLTLPYGEAKGNLKIRKSSADPELTGNNGCYSLKDAVYGVYQNGMEAGTVTTDQNGEGTLSGLSAGDYEVREKTAPKGFALDKQSYSVTITDGQETVLDVTDYPQSDPVAILLGKIDAETTQDMPQGSASLENAEFTVKYYDVQSDTDPAGAGKKPVRTWVLKTNEKGRAYLQDAYKISGDDFYYMTNGEVTIPLGTITIQETKAPKGYLLNPEIFVRQITSKGDAEIVNTYNAPTIPETPQKGVIRLQKKSSEADYGTATLAGAVYEVRDQADTLVDTLTTDKAGNAQSKELPLGIYTVKEKTAPAGFLVDQTAYTVELTAENKTDRVFYKTVTSTETAQRGIIKLQKKSSETDYGTSSLKGAEYGVYKDKACKNKADTLTTDEKGAAQSKELPWGTYYVKETKNPAGFLMDPNVYTVELTTDNRTDRVFYKSVTSTEVPQKGIIELQKLDSETDQNKPQGAGSLKDAEYDIFLKSAYRTGDNTGSKSYKGTLVTDKEGKARSGELPLETYYVIERQPSTGYLTDPQIYEVTLSAENKTDRVFVKKASSEEDIIRGNVEIIKLKEIEDEDEDTFEGLEGVEFTFTSDTTGKVVKRIVTDKNGFATTVDKDNPRGGLIFDTYTVTETKCPEGLKPIEPFKVTIKDEGVTLKGIYKEDKLIVSPVSVVKIDESTGKVIPAANTEFRLLDENKKPITMTTYYPDKIEHKTFKTDENGQFTFPDKLTYGTYYLEEVTAPEGYLKGELLEFKVAEGSTWERPLVVKYADRPVMARIRITKTSGGKKEKLPGAVFEIRAAEEIETPDGTVQVKKGELADTVTTGKDGTAESKDLYLGKYHVIETKQPDGFVRNEQPFEVELKYKDQITELVTEELHAANKPAEIEILKEDKDTGKPLGGVAFKIWNKAMKPENQTDQETGDMVMDGMGIFTGEEQTDIPMGVISEYETNADGKIALQYLAPGTYCIQETRTLPGYVLDETIHEITIDRDGKAEGKDKGSITLKNEITKTDLSKHDITTGKEIEGGRYQVADKDGNIIDEWTGTKEPRRIQGLTAGETYIFKEVLAPEGYLIAQDVEFTIEPSGEVQKVEMYDEPAMGTIEVQKTDAETGEKTAGAVFEVRASEDIATPDGTVRLKKGELADTVTTGKDGTAATKKLFLGRYGVTETRPAPGYVLEEKTYPVELKYKDQNTAAVTGTVQVKNMPTTVVIEKMTAGTEEVLPGVAFQIWNRAMESGPDAGMGAREEHVTEQDGRITLKYLAPGTYCIQETKTLPGYVLNSLVHTFTVDGTGRVASGENAVPAPSVVIRMENDYTKLDISKQDAETGGELPGAELKLMQKKTGRTIETWTSGEKPKRFERLEPGEYVLREISAPKGYKTAPDISFILKESGEVQKVVMKDEYSVGGLKAELPGNSGNGLLAALKTGDMEALAPWIVSTLAAAGIIAAVMARVRRKKESGGKEKED